jgi:hypothetical protein
MLVFPAGVHVFGCPPASSKWWLRKLHRRWLRSEAQHRVPQTRLNAGTGAKAGGACTSRSWNQVVERAGAELPPKDQKLPWLSVQLDAPMRRGGAFATAGVPNEP